MMRLLLNLIITIAFAGTLCGADKVEWAGIFKTPEAKYVYTAQQKGGKYADKTMTILLLPATSDSETAFKALKPKAVKIFNSSTPTTITNGGMLTPSDTFYKLSFSPDMHTSSFAINATNAAYVAFFCQHFPTEFERDAHYLKDIKGTDVEPVHTDPEAKKKAAHHDDHSKPWGEAIGATFLVNMVTITGVVFILPMFKNCVEENPDTLFCLANAFAGGALIAAAFYLMLYEATHLIVYKKEAVSVGYWGSMIIGGFITAQFTDIMVSALQEKLGISCVPAPAAPVEAESNANGDVEKGSDSKEVSTELANTSPPEQSAAASRDCCLAPATTSADAATTGVAATTGDAAATTSASPSGSGNGTEAKSEIIQSENNRMRVLSGVLVGDFMHNLVDGIIIGAAFLGCSKSMAWGITGATIAHEIAQEIADYFVLTDAKQGALTPFMALALNFVSGLSVILGAIIVLGQDSVDNMSQGLLLAYGGGVYLQIGAAECVPRALNLASDSKTGSLTLRVVSLLVFLFGALAIAIILLKHEHCVPSGGGGGHAGHAH